MQVYYGNVTLRNEQGEIDLNFEIYSVDPIFQIVDFSSFGAIVTGDMEPALTLTVPSQLEINCTVTYGDLSNYTTQEDEGFSSMLFNHSWATAGVYTATVNCNNFAMNWTKTTLQHVQDPVGQFDINSTWLFELSAMKTVSWQVNGGSDLWYVSSVGGYDVGVTIGTLDTSLILNDTHYNTVTTYNGTMQVFNNVSQTTTKAFYIRLERLIRGVTIATGQSYYLTGATVDSHVTIQNGSNVNVNVSYDGITWQSASISGDFVTASVLSFTDTYPSKGEKTVYVKVWNDVTSLILTSANMTIEDPVELVEVVHDPWRSFQTATPVTIRHISGHGPSDNVLVVLTATLQGGPATVVTCYNQTNATFTSVVTSCNLAVTGWYNLSLTVSNQVSSNTSWSLVEIGLISDFYLTVNQTIWEVAQTVTVRIQASGDPDITGQVDFGDGYTSTYALITPDIWNDVMYVFSTTGAYSVTGRVTNTLRTLTDTCNLCLIIEEAISGLITSGPFSFLYGSEVLTCWNFTKGSDQINEVSWNGNIQTNVTGYTSPNSGCLSLMDIGLLPVGLHQLNVTVWNQVTGPATVIKEILIVQSIVNFKLELSHTVIVTNGVFWLSYLLDKGSMVNVTLDVNGDVIIDTYHLDAINTNQTSSMSFNTSGTYQFNGVALNTLSSMVDSVTIVVQDPVLNVTITTDEPDRHQTPTQFSLDVNPGAIMASSVQMSVSFGDGNFAYAHHFSQASGSVFLVNHTYGMDGYYNVSVMVWNNVSQWDTYYSITVGVPLDNLTLGLDKVVVATGSPIQTSVTVELGSNIQLLYTYGDGINNTLGVNSGTLQPTSHSYSSAGVYSVKVEASNVFNQLVKVYHIDVIVQDAITVAVLTTDQNIYPLTQDVISDWTMATGTNVSCSLSLAGVTKYYDFPCNLTGSFKLLQNLFLTADFYLVSLSVENLVTSTIVLNKTVQMEMTMSNLDIERTAYIWAKFAPHILDVSLAFGSNVNITFYDNGQYMSLGNLFTSGLGNHTYQINPTFDTVGLHTISVLAVNPLGQISASTVVFIQMEIINGTLDVSGTDTSSSVIDFHTVLNAPFDEPSHFTLMADFGDGVYIDADNFTNGMLNNWHFQHTYPADGVYNISFWASNNLSQWLDERTITVGVPLTGLDLYGPYLFEYPSSLNVYWNISQGSHHQYSLTYDAASQSSFTQTSDGGYLSVTSPALITMGKHTIQITVQNNLNGPLQDTAVIDIVQRITNFTIDLTELIVRTNTQTSFLFKFDGGFETNVTLFHSGNVTIQDSFYQYLTGYNETVLVTFPQSGVYDISGVAVNMLSSVPANTVRLTVQDPVVDVHFNSSDSSAYQTPITFFIVVNPGDIMASSVYIGIDFGDAMSGTKNAFTQTGQVFSLIHGYPDDGYYNVSITIYNNISSWTNYTTILVGTRVQGINMVADKHILATEEQVGMNATVNTGSNIRCSYTYGDGNGANYNLTAVDHRSYHRYSSPGLYQISAVCSNSFSSESHVYSTIIIVQDVVAGLALTRDKIVYPVTSNVSLSWSVQNGTNITCEILVDGSNIYSNALCDKVDTSVVVGSQFPTVGYYTATYRVWNLVTLVQTISVTIQVEQPLSGLDIVPEAFTWPRWVPLPLNLTLDLGSNVNVSISDNGGSYTDLLQFNMGNRSHFNQFPYAFLHPGYHNFSVLAENPLGSLTTYIVVLVQTSIYNGTLTVTGALVATSSIVFTIQLNTGTEEPSHFEIQGEYGNGFLGPWGSFVQPSGNTWQLSYTYPQDGVYNVTFRANNSVSDWRETKQITVGIPISGIRIVGPFLFDFLSHVEVHWNCSQGSHHRYLITLDTTATVSDTNRTDYGGYLTISNYTWLPLGYHSIQVASWNNINGPVIDTRDILIVQRISVFEFNIPVNVVRTNEIVALTYSLAEGSKVNISFFHSGNTTINTTYWEYAEGLNHTIYFSLSPSGTYVIGGTATNPLSTVSALSFILIVQDPVIDVDFNQSRSYKYQDPELFSLQVNPDNLMASNVQIYLEPGDGHTKYVYQFNQSGDSFFSLYHPYIQDGFYNVSLKVNNNISDWETMVNILVGVHVNNITITPDTIHIAKDVMVGFNITVWEGSNINCMYIFGDGSSLLNTTAIAATEQRQYHTYLVPGLYSFSVVAYNVFSRDSETFSTLLIVQERATGPRISADSLHYPIYDDVILDWGFTTGTNVTCEIFSNGVTIHQDDQCETGSNKTFSNLLFPVVKTYNISIRISNLVTLITDSVEAYTVFYVEKPLSGISLQPQAAIWATFEDICLFLALDNGSHVNVSVIFDGTVSNTTTVFNIGIGNHRFNFTNNYTQPGYHYILVVVTNPLGSINTSITVQIQQKIFTGRLVVTGQRLDSLDMFFTIIMNDGDPEPTHLSFTADYGYGNISTSDLNRTMANTWDVPKMYAAEGIYNVTFTASNSLSDWSETQEIQVGEAVANVSVHVSKYFTSTSDFVLVTVQYLKGTNVMLLIDYGEAGSAITLNETNKLENKQAYVFRFPGSYLVSVQAWNNINEETWTDTQPVIVFDAVRRISLTRSKAAYDLYEGIDVSWMVAMGTNISCELSVNGSVVYRDLSCPNTGTYLVDGSLHLTVIGNYSGMIKVWNAFTPAQYRFVDIRIERLVKTLAIVNHNPIVPTPGTASFTITLNAGSNFFIQLIYSDGSGGTTTFYEGDYPSSAASFTVSRLFNPSGDYSLQVMAYNLLGSMEDMTFVSAIGIIEGLYMTGIDTRSLDVKGGVLIGQHLGYSVASHVDLAIHWDDETDSTVHNAYFNSTIVMEEYHKYYTEGYKHVILNATNPISSLDIDTTVKVRYYYKKGTKLIR